MQIASELGGIALAVLAIVGGLVGLIYKIGQWTNTVSTSLSANTASNKELSKRMDTMSTQFETYTREVSGNTKRIGRLERLSKHKVRPQRTRF